MKECEMPLNTWEEADSPSTGKPIARFETEEHGIYLHFQRSKLRRDVIIRPSNKQKSNKEMEKQNENVK
jgi:hypothetical protein